MRTTRDAAVQMPRTVIAFVAICLAASVVKTSRTYSEAMTASIRTARISTILIVGMSGFAIFFSPSGIRVTLS